MNELEIKSSWLKIQINSFYGLNTQQSQTTVILKNKLLKEYIATKSKIKLITNRKSKIKELWKIDGIV